MRSLDDDKKHSNSNDIKDSEEEKSTKEHIDSPYEEISGQNE
jgi:hypothetical protein